MVDGAAPVTDPSGVAVEAHLAGATGTEDRILAATLAVLSRVGIAGLSLEEVAREAGTSRQTVYRYFGNRDALIAATVLREERGFLARIEQAAHEDLDLRDAIEAAIDAALNAAREHPLLDRLLATEPEALLPFLTTGAGPVLTAARPALADLLASRAPDLSSQHRATLVDGCTRLIVSYAINPPDRPVAEVASTLADLLTAGVHTLAAEAPQSPTPTSTA